MATAQEMDELARAIIVNGAKPAEARTRARLAVESCAGRPSTEDGIVLEALGSTFAHPHSESSDASLRVARGMIDDAAALLRGAQFAPESRLPLAILVDHAHTSPGTYDAEDFASLLRRLLRDYAPEQMQQLAHHLAHLGRESANALALHVVVVGLADLPHAVAREALIALKPSLRSVGVGDGF